MSPSDVTARIAKVAKKAADDEQLSPDASAQDYLGELVNLAVEKLGPDPTIGDVARAEESFRRLAEVASGRDPMRLQESEAQPIRITASDWTAALGSLCPGFWPFC